MKITNDGIPSTSIIPKQPVQASPPAVRELGTEGLPQDSSTYSPSPEWLRLLDQVKQQPEVREDRVQAAIQRLRQGYYATPEVAEKTAAAKLNSLD